MLKYSLIVRNLLLKRYSYHLLFIYDMVGNEKSPGQLKMLDWGTLQQQTGECNLLS